MNQPQSPCNERIIVIENNTWRLPESEYNQMMHSVVRRQNSLRNTMRLKIKRSLQHSISKDKRSNSISSESRLSNKKFGYAYESRHQHAMRRQRDSKGRFSGASQAREISDKSSKGKGKKKSKSKMQELDNQPIPNTNSNFESFFPTIDYSHLFEDIEERPEEDEEFLFGVKSGNFNVESMGEEQEFNLFRSEEFE